jgi:hypothetical protein
MTETGAAPAPETTLRQDLSQARSELGTPGTPSEPESTTADAGEGGTAEEPFSIPAEDLAQVTSHPTLSKVHKNLLTDYKKKTTAVSERQRALDEREQELKALDEEGKSARMLWDAMKENPEGMVKELATRYGLTLGEAKKAVKEATEAEDELKALFGDDADAVRPHFDKYFEKKMELALKPFMAYVDSERERQGKTAIQDEIKAFQAELTQEGEGEVTPEVEKEMQKLAAQIDPAPGTTTRQYLRFLWQVANSGATKAQVTKEVVGRINKAVKGREPAEIPSGGSSAGSAVTAGMSLREALRVARSEVKAGR